MAFLKWKKQELFLWKQQKLSYCSRKEYLPLWEAIFDKQEEVVEVLLGLGADPDQKCPLKDQNTAGFTFLESAAMSHDFLIKHLAIAEILIHHGANLNAYSHEKKKNLLQIAITNGNTQCVDLLLKNGAKLKGPGWRGKSPVVSAYVTESDLKCIEMLHLLFKYGVDLKYRDHDGGNNLLHTLIKCYEENETGHWSVFKVAKTLVEAAGMPIDNQNNEGFSALHLAIHYNEYELACYLIEKGADVNLKCKNGLTSVYQATDHGFEEYVELLVDHGADINAKSNGRTALHRACLGNMYWVIKVLLRRGADISAKDLHGSTPLAMLDLNDFEQEDSILELMKEFAKLSFQNVHICESDMNLIRSSQLAKERFEKCLEELLMFSNTKFYASYSYFWILKMSKCVKKLANHMKNEEFSESCLGKSKCGDYYKEDLELIIEEASNIKNDSQKVYSRLRSIFSEFLPDVVIRNLTDHLQSEDLPM